MQLIPSHSLLKQKCIQPAHFRIQLFSDTASMLEFFNKTELKYVKQALDICKFPNVTSTCSELVIPSEAFCWRNSNEASDLRRVSSISSFEIKYSI